MRTKVFWPILSFLIVLALVLTSCRPAAVGEEGKRVTGKVVEKEAPVAKEKVKEVKPAVELPRYGGILNIPLAAEPVSYDPWAVYSMPASDMYYEQLAHGDFTVTEDVWPFYGIYIPDSVWTGCLAESWDQTDPSTVVFHLRKGVHFSNKPPVNGREFTAEDVVYTFKRLLGPGSKADMTALGAIESVTAPDKYTVQFKFTKPQFQNLWGLACRSNTFIVAHEAVEKYGDLSNPAVAVGTGPFIITDYVPGSSLVFKRNPTYWGKDPRYPENSLPYLEGVNFLIIADQSTLLSALRTGKVDRLAGVPWNQVESLAVTNPELLHRKILIETSRFINARCDLEPYSDVRVRYALNIAIDRQAIINDYYKGQAINLNYPVAASWTNWYIPFDQLPDNIRQIFTYNPEKAKQLLAEAGRFLGYRMAVMK